MGAQKCQKVCIRVMDNTYCEKIMANFFTLKSCFILFFHTFLKDPVSQS